MGILYYGRKGVCGKMDGAKYRENVFHIYYLDCMGWRKTKQHITIKRKKKYFHVFLKTQISVILNDYLKNILYHFPNDPD